MKKEHCLCHLATGDMLRAAVAAETPLGKKVGITLPLSAHVTLIVLRTFVLVAHSRYIRCHDLSPMFETFANRVSAFPSLLIRRCYVSHHGHIAVPLLLLVVKQRST